MSWTQAQCSNCWDKDNPDRRATVLVTPDKEICCDCGAETMAGIYTRKDPKTVNFPKVQCDWQDGKTCFNLVTHRNVLNYGDRYNMCDEHYDLVGEWE